MKHEFEKLKEFVLVVGGVLLLILIFAVAGILFSGMVLLTIIVVFKYAPDPYLCLWWSYSIIIIYFIWADVTMGKRILRRMRG